MQLHETFSVYERSEWTFLNEEKYSIIQKLLRKTHDNKG